MPMLWQESSEQAHRKFEVLQQKSYMGMPKNRMGAARPYPLKMANNSMATVCKAIDRHIDMAIVIFFLAAKRCGSPPFFAAGERWSCLSASCLAPGAAGGELPGVERWFSAVFCREPSIVRTSDLPHFRMITLQATHRHMKATVATKMAACACLAAAKIVETTPPTQTTP